MVPKQQGYAIQGNDWPSGTNERGRHDQVPFDEPYGREYLQWGSRVQDGSMVILTQFRIQRYKPLVEINRDKINTPSCC
jgi:hypothetical protein